VAGILAGLIFDKPHPHELKHNLFEVFPEIKEIFDGYQNQLDDALV